MGVIFLATTTKSRVLYYILAKEEFNMPSISLLYLGNPFLLTRGKR